MLDLTLTLLRGLVKLKKIKNLKKTRIGQTTTTHPPVPFFIFLETIGNMKTTQKTHNFPQKNNIQVGA